jgi:hypothetical protein
VDASVGGGGVAASPASLPEPAGTSGELEHPTTLTATTCSVTVVKTKKETRNERESGFFICVASSIARR